MGDGGVNGKPARVALGALGLVLLFGVGYRIGLGYRASPRRLRGAAA